MKTFNPGLLCALLIAGSLTLHAQEKEILALTGAASIEELDEAEYDRLCTLLASPLSINTASLARLQSSGLLTRFQAVSIADYRSRSGDILSAVELGLVDGFTPESAAALAPFLSFQPTGQPGRARTPKPRPAAARRLSERPERLCRKGAPRMGGAREPQRYGAGTSDRQSRGA